VSKVEITDLYRVFSEIAPDGWVDRSRFKNALEILESHGLNPHLRDLSSDKIFELLDINKDNKVDFKEFISGFALLCKGSTEDKIRSFILQVDKYSFSYGKLTRRFLRC
jgi:Ca2+-binding EF-hand superfamily protein